ncbi:MAG TPA: hypothetical protein VM658_20995 [bacterium]|nr:hypothetical protein [bacterium]
MEKRKQSALFGNHVNPVNPEPLAKCSAAILAAKTGTSNIRGLRCRQDAGATPRNLFARGSPVISFSGEEHEEHRDKKIFFSLRLRVSAVIKKL